MSLLHDFILEMEAAGSTGASSIAATPGSLFDGGIIDKQQKKKKRKTIMRRITSMKESLGVDLGRPEFDASDVVSKIDQAVKRSTQNEDTTTFGLEDEDGNIIKVYVRSDQAEKFENSLAVMLAGEDGDDDDENSSLEIAEVLFKLKDEYEIVDVEWPGIVGDEEEEQEVEGAQGAEQGAMPAPGGDAPAAGDMDATEGDMDNLDTTEGEGDDEDMEADEDSAKSALQQVIDMMKSDAEARRAESEARTAEARAKEAEYSAQASSAKVRKEEQVFDMEQEEQVKSDQEKEAKQLAKLARYQHQKAQNAEMRLSMEGKEEDVVNDDKPWKTNDADNEDDDEITLKELSYLIMKNLGHN